MRNRICGVDCDFYSVVKSTCNYEIEENPFFVRKGSDCLYGLKEISEDKPLFAGEQENLPGEISETMKDLFLK